jgi:hypothetical protein
VIFLLHPLLLYPLHSALQLLLSSTLQVGPLLLLLAPALLLLNPVLLADPLLLLMMTRSSLSQSKL